MINQRRVGPIWIVAKLLQSESNSSFDFVVIIDVGKSVMSFVGDTELEGVIEIVNELSQYHQVSTKSTQQLIKGGLLVEWLREIL